MLIVGGFLAAAAALLAGTSGFGFALLATPALVLCGFSLPFVVTEEAARDEEAPRVLGNDRANVEPGRAREEGDVAAAWIGTRLTTSPI